MSIRNLFPDGEASYVFPSKDGATEGQVLALDEDLNLVFQSSSEAGDVLGTANQIVATPQGQDVVLSIADPLITSGDCTITGEMTATTATVSGTTTTGVLGATTATASGTTTTDEFHATGVSTFDAGLQITAGKTDVVFF